MNNDVPVIYDLSVFPDIPATTRMVIVLPTARWNPMARSVIGSMVGVANEEIAVLIADNSENSEKRAFLASIRSINPHILAVVHTQNVGVFNNCLYLYNWSRGIEFIAQIADDDWVSPTYFRDAYELLRDNPHVSCAEVGSTWVDMGDKRLINVSQPSMTGRTPLERMQKWNGSVARVTMYNASRRSCLDVAMGHFLASPLSGITLPENLWELNRLAQGDFVSIPGHGCLVHYPAHASVSGDRTDRFYNLLCRDQGLSMPALFFMGLSTAIQAGIMLMGKDSPIADSRQRVSCGNYVFAQIFRTNFMPWLQAGMSDPQLLSLFERDPHFLNELKPFLEPSYSNSPVMNREIYELFVRLLRMTESRVSNDDTLLSERFDRFARAHYWDLPDLPTGNLAQYLIDVEVSTEVTQEDGKLNSGELNEKSTWTDVVSGGYPKWIARRQLADIDAQLHAERMLFMWKSKPTFWMLTTVFSGEESWLANTIDALSAQLYQNWRLVVLSDIPSPNDVFATHDQLAWVVLEGASIAQGVNACVGAMDSNDWMVFIAPGAQLPIHALATFGDYAALHPDWRLMYADGDYYDQDGTRIHPVFRPDLNIELLRSSPYMGSLFVRADAFLQYGGLGDCLLAEEYDLSLRILDACGEGAIGHIDDVLWHQPIHSPRPVDYTTAMAALRAHLDRNEIEADVVEQVVQNNAGVDESYGWQVRYRLKGTPSVGIIIPSRDAYHLITQCLDSLFLKTTYPDFSVIVVDNQSTDPDVLSYYHKMSNEWGGHFQVVYYDAPFNFSAQCNLGVESSSSEYILLLNNDTVIVQPDWIERMMGFATQPGVGVVGARLVYPGDGRLQHAGVVLGLLGQPGAHIYYGQDQRERLDPLGRSRLDQDYSAVSAACLLTSKRLYLDIGGLDEERHAVLYNDVDFCLRVCASGRRVVWTPQSTLVHEHNASIREVPPVEQAKTLDRRISEERAMFDRWGAWIARDPAYNRHLSLSRTHGLPEMLSVHQWDAAFHDRKRLLCFPDAGMAGRWRVSDPVVALGRAGILQSTLIESDTWHLARIPPLTEVMRMAPDAIYWHHALSDLHLKQMQRVAEQLHIPQYFAMDDLLTCLPDAHPGKKTMAKDIRKRMRQAFSLCGKVLVSTEPLVQLCQEMGGQGVVIVPNRLSREHWHGLLSERGISKRPRVGWAGAQQHHGDLAMMVEVVKATAEEVDWIFMGMCTDELRPYIREEHPFVRVFEDYPAKLASLNLDIAIAPLEINAFNEAKSNLRLLEYGIMGWPVIATDIFPYQTNTAPVCRVQNTSAAWIDAIRAYAHDLDAAYQAGDALKRWVEAHYILEDHLDSWTDALDLQDWYRWAMHDRFDPRLKPKI